jgi:hypothetical protein
LADHAAATWSDGTTYTRRGHQLYLGCASDRIGVRAGEHAAAAAVGLADAAAAAEQPDALPLDVLVGFAMYTWQADREANIEAAKTESCARWLDKCYALCEFATAVFLKAHPFLNPCYSK